MQSDAKLLAYCQGKTPIIKNVGSYGLTRGEIPITKNIMVIDEHSNQLTPTYPKRAKQIVKQGRAVWVDESTIRMLAGSPEEMRADEMPEANARTEWAEYFRKLAEQLVANDEIARKAIEAVEAYSNREGLPPGDSPGEAIARIVEVNQRTKAEIFRSLTEFTNAMLKEKEERILSSILEAMDKVPRESPWMMRNLKELAESLTGIQNKDENED